MKTATCRRCHARIVWATTLLGKPMPLDYGPAPDPGSANVAAWIDGAGKLRARVLTADERPAAYETLRMPHFATCPNWAQLRRQTRAVP